MILSNMIAFFIIVTTGATLHGARHHEDRHGAASGRALRPLAGPLRSFYSRSAFVGTGLLAVPVLAGSAGYAVRSASAGKAALNCARTRRRGFTG